MWKKVTYPICGKHDICVGAKVRKAYAKSYTNCTGSFWDMTSQIWHIWGNIANIGFYVILLRGNISKMNLTISVKTSTCIDGNIKKAHAKLYKNRMETFWDKNT